MRFLLEKFTRPESARGGHRGDRRFAIVVACALLALGALPGNTRAESACEFGARLIAFGDNYYDQVVFEMESLTGLFVPGSSLVMTQFQLKTSIQTGYKKRIPYEGISESMYLYPEEPFRHQRMRQVLRRIKGCPIAEQFRSEADAENGGIQFTLIQYGFISDTVLKSGLIRIRDIPTGRNAAAILRELEPWARILVYRSRRDQSD